MDHRPVTVLAAVLGGSLAAAAAAQPGIMGIGSLTTVDPESYAYGISADGGTVVGESVSQNTFIGEASYWRLGVLTGLGLAPGATAVRNTANAASSTGDFLAGFTRYSTSGIMYRAYRYQVSTGQWIIFGPSGGDAGTISAANAISADGQVLAGYGNLAYTGVPAGNRVARKWRVQPGGTISVNALGVLAGDTSSSANGVSGTGAVTVGVSSGPSSTRGFVHSQAGLSALPTLVNGPAAYEARGISSDGTTIVGYATAAGASTSRAVKWVQTGGLWTITDLGTLPGGGGASLEAASADGSVLVGNAVPSGGVSPKAVVWTAAGGMRTVEQVLADAGVIDNSWDLQYATGVSGDGSKICGWGIHNNVTEGFVVTLPPPGPGACNAADVAGLGGAPGPDGQLTADDVVVFLAAFFANDLAVADIAVLGGGAGADGQLTADDIVFFLAQFFSPCNP